MANNPNLNPMVIDTAEEVFTDGKYWNFAGCTAKPTNATWVVELTDTNDNIIFYASNVIPGGFSPTVPAYINGLKASTLTAATALVFKGSS